MTKCRKVNQDLNKVLMSLRIVCGFQHVPKVIAFDLFPIDLVKSNFHGLHKLQQKEGQQSIRETRIGHCDARGG